MALSTLGRFPEAMSHGTEAVRIAETVDHPFTLVEALTALGGVCLVKGDLADAIDALERGLALSREWKFQPWATLSRLGYAYSLSGRLPDARRLLDEIAQSDTTVSSMGVGQATQVAWLGEACALDRQFDEALQHARAALSLAQEHEERGDEAWAHRLLGEIAERRGRPRRRGAGRRPLPSRARAGHRARHASPRGPMPSRPWRSVSPRRPPRGSARVPHRGRDHVPRDGDANLARPRREGTRRAGMTRRRWTRRVATFRVLCVHPLPGSTPAHSRPPAPDRAVHDRSIACVRGCTARSAHAHSRTSRRGPVAGERPSREHPAGVPARAPDPRPSLPRHPRQLHHARALPADRLLETGWRGYRGGGAVRVGTGPRPPRRVARTPM